MTQLPNMIIEIVEMRQKELETNAKRQHMIVSSNHHRLLSLKSYPNPVLKFLRILLRTIKKFKLLYAWKVKIRSVKSNRRCNQHTHPIDEGFMEGIT
jgi:hypothetical protein